MVIVLLCSGRRISPVSHAAVDLVEESWWLNYEIFCLISSKIIWKLSNLLGCLPESHKRYTYTSAGFVMMSKQNTSLK